MHHSSISGLAKPQSHHALGCLLHRFLWFTVNTNFYPSVHLTVQDLQVDAGQNPSSLRVHIKTSKTDPFWAGLFHLSRLWSGFSLSYRCNHGLSTPPRVIKGPHFIESTGQPLIECTRLHFSSPPWQQREFLVSSPVTVFASAPRPQQHNLVSLTT